MDIEQDPHAGGLADANAWLRERRARRLERAPPPRRRAAIAFVALLHLLLVLALRSGMQPRFGSPTGDARPLVIRFDSLPRDRLDDPALSVVPPRPADAAPSAVPRLPATGAPAARAPAASPAHADAPSTSLRLFEPDGGLRLSREVIDAARPAPAAEPDFRDRPRTRDIWRAGRPAVVYAPTRFERYWKPDRENLAEELVRKVPLLGLVLQNPGGRDRCPPRSLDPDCEGQVGPAFAEDPFPD